MWKTVAHSSLRYGVAVLSIGVALLLGWTTPLSGLSPSALFFAAVMVSSWYGGLGPGLLATLLSALSIDYFLVPPVFTVVADWGDVVRTIVFVLEAVLISWLNAKRRRLEESLRERNDELVSMHRQKDAFLATLGHELRNLLTPVCNGLDVLRLRCAGDSELAHICDTAERRARHMVRLVDDLLDLSRMTRGMVRLEMKPVELAAVVEDAVETSRSLIDARHHQLTVSLSAEPVWLEADAARLEQVVVNLLNNAAKYTEPGGRIWLSAARENDRAVVRVRDTGAGIAPEFLPRMFDLYAQGEHSPGHFAGGLGIGLSLVRSLVELHGGAVEVYSAGPGRGSEFVVRLPVMDEPPRRIESPLEETEPGGQPLRVLIVDDSVDAAKMLAMLLALWGHDVHVVHDGPSAIQAVPQYDPQVVLLDIGLPGMDGYEVARRLRDLAGPDDLLLVALTGYAQDEDRRRSRDAGFDHHLVKPVDVDELQRILRQSAVPVAC